LVDPRIGKSKDEYCWNHRIYGHNKDKYWWYHRISVINVLMSWIEKLNWDAYLEMTPIKIYMEKKW